MKLKRHLTPLLMGLGAWSTLRDNIIGADGTVQVIDGGAAPQSKRFYRIVIP